MCILGDDAGGFGSSGFTVQWIYAGIVAYLYLLYEGARIRYPLLSFSCTLLVTGESGAWTDDPSVGNRSFVSAKILKICDED